MTTIRWGILGCGDVCEVKSGPGLQKAEGSELIAVMRRDAERAEDFARRHNVPTWTSDADSLIGNTDVDAVYIATPPSTHLELTRKVAAAGKPDWNCCNKAKRASYSSPVSTEASTWSNCCALPGSHRRSRIVVYLSATRLTIQLETLRKPQSGWINTDIVAFAS